MKRIFIISALLCAGVSPGVAEIADMRCEYLSGPIGIDTDSPRLTWQLDGILDPESGLSVEVARDPGFKDSKVFKAADSNSALIGIDTLPGVRYYWRVVGKDRKGKTLKSKTAQFESGKFSPAQWSARWIGDGKDMATEQAPVFRKEFTVEKLPKEARTYISALGYYDMKINGRRVSDHHMDPGFTSYSHRSLYATHDVTDFLKKGTNTVEVTLGNGFANCQSRDAWGQEKAPWRTRPIFICEIMADGKVLAATDATWLASDSPVAYNNLYSGEHYDARLAPAKWNNAVVSPSPNKKLKSQSMPAIRPVAEYDAKLLRSFGDTVHVFDVGCNIAGVCELTVSGEKGTRLELAHGELLKSDGHLEQGNLDIYYHPLKEDEAFQTDRYVIGRSGVSETYQPQFTYHGFRYVEVRSTQPIPATDIKLKAKMMRTDIARKGRFRCSNQLLNSIYDATMLTYEDNLHSIPTDCPQREKNGWTADGHVSIDLGLLNYDGITLYEKWMDDFIDNQLENGNISGIIPSAGWGYGDSPGPVWDAGLFIIPLALYDYYGDDSTLRKMYPSMLRYMHWLKGLEKEDGLLDCGIGDWLPYDTSTPTDFTSSLYAFADYSMMTRICGILGEDPSEWKRKADEMKDRINARWFDKDKVLYANSSQAAQAIALYWDIVPEGYANAVAANLNEMVAANGYALDFGLLGSKSVLRMLTRYGYPETAYRMATRTDAPSWGNWIVNCGYTTLAETWTLSPEFRDASLNHAFFGDIAAWMTNDIAGLNTDPAQPGFRNVVIRPTFMEGLDWAEAEYDSVKGPVGVRWQRRGDGKIEVSVKVPFGSTATVDLKGRIENVGAGSHTFLI